MPYKGILNIKFFRNSKFKIRNSRLGFTLIELMVVIAMIAILAVIGFYTYSSVRASGRDSRRIQDIQEISKALEQIRVANGSYNTAPAASDFVSGNIPYDPKSSGVRVSTVTGCGNTDSASGNYSTTRQCWYCLKPSTNTGGFCNTSTDKYIDDSTVYSSSLTSWTLCTNLEKTFNGNNYYCLPNQQ